MSVTFAFDPIHNRGGEIAPPEARQIHKNDIEQ
jgi:hypothetical protein